MNTSAKSTNGSLEAVVAIHLDTNRRFVPLRSGLWDLPITCVGVQGRQIRGKLLVPIRLDPGHDAFWQDARYACLRLRRQQLFLHVNGDEARLFRSLDPDQLSLT